MLNGYGILEHRWILSADKNIEIGLLAKGRYAYSLHKPNTYILGARTTIIQYAMHILHGKLVAEFLFFLSNGFGFSY